VHIYTKSYHSRRALGEVVHDWDNRHIGQVTALVFDLTYDVFCFYACIYTWICVDSRCAQRKRLRLGLWALCWYMYTYMYVYIYICINSRCARRKRLRLGLWAMLISLLPSLLRCRCMYTWCIHVYIYNIHVYTTCVYIWHIWHLYLLDSRLLFSWLLCRCVYTRCIHVCTYSIHVYTHVYTYISDLGLVQTRSVTIRNECRWYVCSGVHDVYVVIHRCVLWGDMCCCTQSRILLSYCDTMQHTATHCNTLQHTVTHCNTCRKDMWCCRPRWKIASRETAF